MKAFVLNQNENDWRGFIYDKDVCDSKVIQRYFPDGKAIKMNRDPETVSEARDEARTVITSNGDHFIRYTRDAQKRSVNPRCEDCWGLVIAPNRDLQREYAFRKAAVQKGVLIGGKHVPWKAVLWANLCVRITSDGKVQVSKFERCEFCKRDLPVEAEWYDSLPSLG